MMGLFLSPLTDTQVPTESQEGFFFCLEHGDMRINLHDEFITLHPGETYNGLSYKDQKEGWALIRSKLKAGWVRGVRKVMVVPDIVLKRYEEDTDVVPAWSGWVILSFEREVEEAKRIGFVEKALRSLDILASEWMSAPDQPFSAPCMSVSSTGLQLQFVAKKETVDWRCYGCDYTTAPLVYEFLLESGYLGTVTQGGQAKGLKLTPKGLLKLEELSQGRVLESRQVFFIRPWDKAFDKFFEPLALEIETIARCKIRAVWDEPHNEKIDERILRQIRESGVVLLLIAPERFNVGLEAGYALALNKPIVTFRKQPRPKTPPHLKKFLSISER